MTEPGWFVDPAQPSLLRYWDGRDWTEHTTQNPSAAFARPPQQVPPANGGASPVPERNRRTKVILVAVSLIAVIAGGGFVAREILAPAPEYDTEPWSTYTRSVTTILSEGEYEADDDGQSCTSLVEGSVLIGWVDADSVDEMGESVPNSWEASDEPIGGYSLSPGDTGSIIEPFPGSSDGTTGESGYTGYVCGVTLGDFSMSALDLPRDGTDTGKFFASSTCERALGLPHFALTVAALADDCFQELSGSLHWFDYCTINASPGDNCFRVLERYDRWLDG